MPKFMLHSHYKPEKSWPKVAGGVGLLIISLFIVWTRPPGNWAIEAGVVALVGGGLFLIAGKLVSIGVVGVILMRRFGILDGITFGVWVAIIGLISLIN